MSFLFFHCRFKNERDRGGNSRLGRPEVKGKGVGSFGYLDHDGIVGTLVRVVLGELHPQATGLDANRGVTLGIEARGPS
jgi:hypothetical protein